MAKILTVCSGKGGVGKSTVSACIAAAVVCKGKRVLLIDADQGLGGLAAVLGLKDPPLFDIYDAFAGRCELHDTIAGVEGLAGLNFAAAALSVTADKFLDGERLAYFCRAFEKQFDFILIDSAAGVGAEFYAAATAGGAAVLVTTGDRPAMESASKTAVLLREMERDGYLIINKFDRRLVKKKINPNIDEFIDSTGFPILGVVPWEDEFAGIIHDGVITLPISAVSVLPFNDIADRLCGTQVPLRGI